MPRTPTVGGNWKMNTDRRSAVDLARAVAAGAPDARSVEVAVFPPFPYLLAVGQALEGSPVRLGAQDLCQHPDGAYTGEVSAAMLKDCGVRVVLCGHSERRHVIGEPDELVNHKALAALAAGLEVVLCIGETLDQRRAGQTDAVNERQLRAGLAGVSPSELPRLVVAYEPVWAIGTGVTASPDDAQQAHAHARAVLASLFGHDAASRVRIQYGGSVKASNAPELFAQPDIDGGLIGGASLKADEFAAIINAAGA